MKKQQAVRKEGQSALLSAKCIADKTSVSEWITKQPLGVVEEQSRAGRLRRGSQGQRPSEARVGLKAELGRHPRP